jgi:hypothetical protein
MTLYKVRTIKHVAEDFLVHWADDTEPTSQQLTEQLSMSASYVVEESSRLVTSAHKVEQTMSRD